MIWAKEAVNQSCQIFAEFWLTVLEISIIYIESSCLECFQDGRWVSLKGTLNSLWNFCGHFRNFLVRLALSFSLSLFLPQTLFEKFSVSSHSSPRGHECVWLCTCVWACVGVCLKCCVDLSGVISDLWWSRSCWAWRCPPVCHSVCWETHTQTHKQ